MPLCPDHICPCFQKVQCKIEELHKEVEKPADSIALFVLLFLSCDSQNFHSDSAVVNDPCASFPLCHEHALFRGGHWGEC